MLRAVHICYLVRELVELEALASVGGGVVQVAASWVDVPACGESHWAAGAASVGSTSSRCLSKKTDEGVLYEGVLSSVFFGESG